MAKRSTASATISFGLVSIPVKVYLTASADNVSFNAITKAGNRVKQKWVDAVTGDDVSQADTQKGYEYAPGQYVLFTKDELKQLGEGDDGGTMEIREFIPASALNPLHVEKTYYLDVGKKSGGDKAYRLLVAALKREKKLAVSQWISRGRQHLMIIGVVDDALVLYQMFYQNEIREIDLDCATYTPRDVEVDMACQLINALSNDKYDHGKYVNSFNQRVEKAVEQKRAGKTVEVEDKSEPNDVSDLFAALKASLSKKSA